MSDERLRLLERSCAQGDDGAVAHLLRARLRTGELAPERARLAAYLGSAAACQALGLPPPHRPRGRLALERWVRGLEPWGKEVAVRAALAAGRLDGGADRAARALTLAERWLLGLAAAPAPTRRVQGIPWTENLEAALAAGGPFTAALQAGHVAAKLTRAASPLAVWTAITRELIPWALGETR